MKKNTKLVWRLGKLPTPDELRELVKDKIITQEEAREILFDQEDGDTKSLKEEIKFLRQVVQDMGASKYTTVIRDYYPKFNNHGWYQPYYNTCSGVTNAIASSDLNTSGINLINAQANSVVTSFGSGTVSLTDITKIKTF